jgi:hypothetical protein
MAKPKPDKIIRYEHVLGKVERQQLEQASAAYSINRVMSPLVTLLNDVTGVATVLGLLAVGLGFKYNVYTAVGATTSDLIQDFADQLKQAREDLAALRSDVAAGQAAATSWFSSATDPMSYVDPLLNFAQGLNLQDFTPVGFVDTSLDALGLPTIMGTIDTGVSNLDLNPNYGDPWFGLDLNPFN